MLAFPAVLFYLCVLGEAASLGTAISKLCCSACLCSPDTICLCLIPFLVLLSEISLTGSAWSRRNLTVPWTFCLLYLFHRFLQMLLVHDTKGNPLEAFGINPKSYLGHKSQTHSSWLLYVSRSFTNISSLKFLLNCLIRRKSQNVLLISS